jgi:hypothetical protein
LFLLLQLHPLTPYTLAGHRPLLPTAGAPLCRETANCCSNASEEMPLVFVVFSFFSVLNDEDPCLLMAIMLLIDRQGSEIMFEFNFWKWMQHLAFAAFTQPISALFGLNRGPDRNFCDRNHRLVFLLVTDRSAKWGNWISK